MIGLCHNEEGSPLFGNLHLWNLHGLHRKHSDHHVEPLHPDKVDSVHQILSHEDLRLSTSEAAPRHAHNVDDVWELFTSAKNLNTFCAEARCGTSQFCTTWTPSTWRCTNMGMSTNRMPIVSRCDKIWWTEEMLSWEQTRFDELSRIVCEDPSWFFFNGSRHLFK